MDFLKQDKPNQKYIYELVTGDSLVFVFCIASGDRHALQIAMRKTKDEGELYEFSEDDIIMKIPVSDYNEFGVYEYINHREVI